MGRARRALGGGGFELDLRSTAPRRRRRGGHGARDVRGDDDARRRPHARLPLRRAAGDAAARLDVASRGGAGSTLHATRARRSAEARAAGRFVLAELAPLCAPLSDDPNADGGFDGDDHVDDPYAAVSLALPCADEDGLGPFAAAAAVVIAPAAWRVRAARVP